MKWDSINLFYFLNFGTIFIKQLVSSLVLVGIHTNISKYSSYDALDFIRIFFPSDDNICLKQTALQYPNIN